MGRCVRLALPRCRQPLHVISPWSRVQTPSCCAGGDLVLILPGTLGSACPNVQASWPSQNFFCAVLLGMPSNPLCIVCVRVCTPLRVFCYKTFSDPSNSPLFSMPTQSQLLEGRGWLLLDCWLSLAQHCGNCCTEQLWLSLTRLFDGLRAACIRF